MLLYTVDILLRLVYKLVDNHTVVCSDDETNTIFLLPPAAINSIRDLNFLIVFYSFFNLNYLKTTSPTNHCDSIIGVNSNSINTVNPPESMNYCGNFNFGEYKSNI